MLARLAPLVGIGEPRRVRLQHGLSVRAPLAALEQPQLCGQLVDAAGDLLAICTRREALHQPADLEGLEPPAVAWVRRSRGFKPNTPNRGPHLGAGTGAFRR